MNVECEIHGKHEFYPVEIDILGQLVIGCVCGLVKSIPVRRAEDRATTLKAATSANALTRVLEGKSKNQDERNSV